MSKTQSQSSGDDSQNIQAGRDVVVHVGVTVEQARQIALDVFHANFVKLSEAAAELAETRAEKLTRDFLEELQKRAPHALSSVHDPDMQRAIFNAQREYACSGEEDLDKVLVDLLVDRAEQRSRDIKTVVLNEAITTVPKLTIDQRSAIVICFLARYTRCFPPSLGEFYQYLANNWAPFVSSLPTKHSAYQHIEYTGAGSISTVGHMPLGTVLLASSRGFFTRGFDRQEVQPPLDMHINDPKLFKPCLRNPNSLQVSCMSEDELNELKPYLKSIADGEDLFNPLRNLFMYPGVMGELDVQADVIDDVPGLARLFDVWSQSNLKSMTLTSVGLAIGYAYWRRIRHDVPDLSVWL
jgi:hypothetical protein